MLLLFFPHVVVVITAAGVDLNNKKRGMSGMMPFTLALSHHQTQNQTQSALGKLVSINCYGGSQHNGFKVWKELNFFKVKFNL